MTEEPDPPPMKDAKGRFLPGHKLGRGRPKGSENKFGPNFREKLVNGITRAGIQKAKKAGVNQKVDGLEFYVEDLATTNSSAAATLISKLIPPEPLQPELSGSPTIINVNPVLSGNMYAPGNTVLLPFDEAAKAWEAFRGGNNMWKEYLKEIEPQLTLAAFQNLCSLVPPEPEPKAIPLRLLEAPDYEGDNDDDHDHAA